jgi:predicted phage terminase large subunit-like protein
MRDRANRALVSTVKSRRATPKTPIIIIMQRLAEQDPTGFIRDGKLGLEFKIVEIPALIDDVYLDQLDPRYRDDVDSSERDESGRFSYWPYKEPLQELLTMERGGLDKDGDPTSRFVFSGQYQQRPTPLGGDIIKSSGFRRYSVLPNLIYRAIYADTAQKTAERNDYSVFECWGLGDDGKIYLIDMIRGKWQASALQQHAIDFWNKHASSDEESTLRIMKVEDKSSGTGLVQTIATQGSIPIEGIERSKDKLTRVMDAVPYIDVGKVCIPEDAPWVSDFVTECEAFTADDTHKHDDQIDPMCDAINDMLGRGPSIYDAT